MTTPNGHSVLKKLRGEAAQKGATKVEAAKNFPTVRKTEYKSVPVDIPESFLAPLDDASAIEIEKIDFKNSVLPEYRNLYAVVLDNVLSQAECDELVRMAERSVGPAAAEGDEGDGGESSPWKPALVNAGRNYEVAAPEYRNSDRIIWDNEEVVRRLFARVLQGAGMKEYLSALYGKKYAPVVGRETRVERWRISGQGANERMRFLRYGEGQFFKEHCDGTYETPDGSQRSFYTLHLYLNDSAQAFGIPEGSDRKDSNGREYVRGGATTFHSFEMDRRMDVDPKAGRVLIFQHRRLLHSGDLVTKGIKYTMRTDLMYEWEEVNDGDDMGGVSFG